MASTVTLYTTTLEHIETLNITALELNRQIFPNIPVSEELKVSTTFPVQLPAFENHSDLVVHIQAPKADVDKVCRMDWYELIHHPLWHPSDRERSVSKLTLHPLHNDAQTIVKAVLNKRDAEKPKEHPLGISPTALKEAAEEQFTQNLMRWIRQDLSTSRTR